MTEQSRQMADSILIVDDEAPVRYVLSHMVESLGAIPFAVGDAVEARAIMAAKTFACALLDKNLPGESGLELLPWLRKAQPDCLVIMLTAYANLESTVD